LRQSGTSDKPNQDPEYKVVVGPGEDVYIFIADTRNDPYVSMAPRGLIVHDFNGRAVSSQDMTNPKTQPITRPNFAPTVSNAPYIQLTDSGSDWQGVPQAYQYWIGSPLVLAGVEKAVNEADYPFVHFNSSTIASVTGPMQYGIIFALTRLDPGGRGQTLEFFYFDPFLTINGDVGQRVSAAMRAKIEEARRTK
jgi:hypothetical protein